MRPMTQRSVLIALSLVGLTAGAVAVSAVGQRATPTVVNPEKLTWNSIPVVPGVDGATVVGNPAARAPYVVFARYRAGVKVAPHSHPDQRIVTVLSGTFYAGHGVKFDESKLKALKPGTVMIIPANAPHYGWAKDGPVLLEETGFGPTRIDVLKAH